jgi:CheY-like chemotaxis protein
LEALLFLRQAVPYATVPRPSVVLLDLNLPKVSGYDVLESVKTDPGLKDVPVIVLTGSDAPADIERCYALGANAYAVKPGSPEALDSFVRSLEDFWFVQCRLPRRV